MMIQKMKHGQHGKHTIKNNEPKMVNDNIFCRNSTDDTIFNVMVNT